MKTQHFGNDDKKVRCKLCSKLVRPRSLTAHQGKGGCQKEQRKRGVIQEVDLTTEDAVSEGEMVVAISTSNSLPQIVDPVVVSAWLFAKVLPWGPQPETTQIWRGGKLLEASHEIMDLKTMAYHSILRVLEGNDYYSDQFFADALICLTMGVYYTEGWEAMKRHMKACVRLIYIQMEAAQSRKGGQIYLRTAVPASVYESVLRGIVPDSAVEHCARLITMSIDLLRIGAVDINAAPQMHPDEEVWRRVDLVEQHHWYGRYAPQVAAITDLASSITAE